MKRAREGGEAPPRDGPNYQPSGALGGGARGGGAGDLPVRGASEANGGGVDFRPSGALGGGGGAPPRDVSVEGRLSGALGGAARGSSGGGGGGGSGGVSSSLADAPTPNNNNCSGGDGGGGGGERVAERASFALSGALARDSATGNSRGGAVLKWTPPPDARPPDRPWRLFVYKGDAGAEPVDTLFLHRQPAYMFGRDAAAADVPLAHPSCSGQHAVLQFRGVAAPREPGDVRPPAYEVRPYLLDLESTHGTWLNGARAPPARYVQLKAGDVLRFAHSSREYVLVCPEAKASTK